MSKTTIVKFKDGSFNGEVTIDTVSFNADLHEYVSGSEPVVAATNSENSAKAHEKLKKDFDELSKQNADLLSENGRLKEYTATQEAEIKGRDEIIAALELKLKPEPSEDDKPAKTK